MEQVDFGFVASAADAPGTSDAELYRTVMRDVDFHTDLGFETVWMIEHHFSDYFPTPSPLLALSYVAAKHPQLNLGTCVMVLPWYEPLRLAGEIAMLSTLTEGELYLGIGRGTAKYEYDAFGIDMNETRDRFREVWEIVRTALTGEPFTYDGKYLSVSKQISVRPNVPQDRVHFFGAIGSPDSAAVMAELGLAPICTTIGDSASQQRTLETWSAAAAEHGVVADPMRPIMINCIVADSDEEAIRQAQQYIPAFMKAQVDHYTPDETDWEQLPSYAKWKGQFAGMRAKMDPANIPAWTTSQLVGSPDTVAERIHAYHVAGFSHLFLHTATAGVPHEVRWQWVKRFATDIAPQFSSHFP